MRTKPRSRSAARAAAAAIVAAALLTVSCWLPLFDPEVSASEKLAKKLGNPIISFTLEDVSRHLADDGWFVPERGDFEAALPFYGLLVRTEDFLVHCTPVSYYGDIGPSTWYDNEVFTIGNSFKKRPFVISSSVLSNQILIFSNNTTPVIFRNMSDVISWDDGNPLPINGGVLGAGGVSITQALEDSNDNRSWCYINSSTGAVEYYTMYPYQSGYLNFLDPPQTELYFPYLDSFFIPGTFLDMGIYLYLSCGMSDGSWAIYRWEKAFPSENPVRYPAVYGPVIAGLMDGRLLAFDGITTTVLSPDMKMLFSFPSGKLRFVHERYDSVNNESVCVFTRTAFLRNSNNDDRGKVRIEIFEFPASRLSELGS